MRTLKTKILLQPIRWGWFALGLLLTACDSQPKLSQLQLDQARNALLANQPEQARVLLNGDFDSTENRHQADCLLARAWYSGKFRVMENSIRFAKACLEKNPNAVEMRLILGSELHLTGKWAQARLWLAQPLEHPDYCAKAARVFSDPEFEVNDGLLQHCLTNNNPAVLEYGRRIAMLNGDQDTAMQYAHQLLDSNLLSALSYYRLGLWFRAQKQDEQSAKALKISHHLRAVVGRRDLESGLASESLDELASLYELGFDNHPDLVIREIKWYWHRGNKRRAQERLLELTEKQGTKGHMGLGLEAESMGQPDVAIAWLQPLAEQGHVDAKISLARIFAQNPKRKKAAHALLDELLSSHPYCGVCYLLSYQMNPDAAGAESLLERAKALSPWDQEIQAH